MTALYPHADLTQGRLVALAKKVDAKRWALCDEMIAAGRGHEKPSETRTKTDELALRVNALADELDAVAREERRRRRFSGSLKPIPAAYRQSFAA